MSLFVFLRFENGKVFCIRFFKNSWLSSLCFLLNKSSVSRYKVLSLWASITHVCFINESIVL